MASDPNNLQGFTRRPRIGRCIWFNTGSVVWGSSAVAVPYFNAQPVKGRDVCNGLTVLSDPVGGTRFVCTETGSYSFMLNLGYTVSDYVGISINLTPSQQGTNVRNVSDAGAGAVLAWAIPGNNQAVAVSVPVGLNAGDIVYPHGSGTAVIGAALFSLIATRLD